MSKLIPVLITTEYRGVFFGYISEDDITKTSISVKKAKMAINWGTERGVMQLAKEGPTSESKISDDADIPALHKVTAIFHVTEKAEQKWISA